MSSSIKSVTPLSNPWPGTDPFLFCARHTDSYPSSDGAQGVPASKLGNRPLGNDFSRTNGFSMYYGETVPGFPAHPHRGFETVTIVPSGLVDHSDSLGATARYGDGDVQWLTAGEGVMHAEMFPLRSETSSNTLDLYQIWLNLPAAKKMVPPAFVMLWDENIPRYTSISSSGGSAVVKVIAGAYRPVESNATSDIVEPLPAAPNSWASDPQSNLAIWLITLEPQSELTLPAALLTNTERNLYFDAGEELVVDGTTVPAQSLIEVEPHSPLSIRNDKGVPASLLILQGVPLGEPVVAQGPFVMNTQEEISQARRDFARTQFGGWPWASAGPVHAAGTNRFARYPNGNEADIPSR